MKRPLSGILIFLVCFVLAGCVSKRQYMQLESDLTQQLQLAHEKLELTEQKLKEAEETQVQCETELASQKERYARLQTDVKENQSVLVLQRKMEEELKDKVANQSVTIEALEGSLKVTFIDKILFRTGSAEINVQGKETLLKVANSINQSGENLIRVEGHTDNIPIGPVLQQTFPTNWELSTSRATAVVRFLQEQGQLASEQLSACGFSYYRPVNSHETEEGRHQNRRIEIFLIPTPMRS